MYITINDIIGSKTIDLSYPIEGKEALALVLLLVVGPAGRAPLCGLRKLQLLACLAIMFSISYGGL